MGTWANDPFGNDIACDWVFDLLKKAKSWGFRNQSLAFIRATLEEALSADEDCLNARVADRAIAAADTVARLRGHFFEKNAYTKSLDAWVEKQTAPVPQELVALALSSIDRILTEPSELVDLWEESGEAESWKIQIEGLRERLKAAPIR